MKLTQLDAQFVRFESADSFSFVEKLADASGMLFLCPLCFARQGEVGTHSILTWFRDRGVPDAATPGPARWVVSGSSLDDLTLSPSVHLTGPGCGWHGFVRAGDAS